jgi:hypothetical protein
VLLNPELQDVRREFFKDLLYLIYMVVLENTPYRLIAFVRRGDAWDKSWGPVFS